MNWNAFAFFHSLRNFPLSKQYLKISFKGLQIKSQIFTILILIVSWPWALFGLLFLEYHHWKIQLLIVIHVFFFLFFFFCFLGVFLFFWDCCRELTFSLVQNTVTRKKYETFRVFRVYQWLIYLGITKMERKGIFLLFKRVFNIG